MSPAARAILLVLLLGVLGLCQGHGRLRCPPGRSVLWRDGYRAPDNYQDTELNCGGSYTHWQQNGGKCGVCGDPFGAAVEQNQPPNGIYAKSILTECYDSSTIDYFPAFVEITANHKGYIEFRMCPNNDFKKPVTQECLDKNVLRIRDARGKDHGTRFKVKSGQRNLHLHLKIPTGMECEQCVIQWRYIAGNSWGCDGRRCGIGYGEQESFFNCADIAILPDCSKVTVARARRWSRSVCRKETVISKAGKPVTDNTKAKTNEQAGSNSNSNTNTVKPPPNTTKTPLQDGKKTNENDKNKDASKTKTDSASTSSKKTSSGDPKSTSGTGRDTKTESESKSSDSNAQPTTSTAKPKSPAQRKPDGSSSGSTGGKEPEKSCYAVGIWSNIRSMHYWCRLNCRRGNCPSFMCACVTVQTKTALSYL